MEKSALAKVSVIIVNYNGRFLLGDCLEALLKTNYPSSLLEIIVVDNNSQDDSVTFLKNNFPQVTLIEARANLGFTGGNNLGYQYASGEYIALLNSDTQVDPNWLSALLQTAQAKKVGIVSPKLYYDVPYLKVSVTSSVIPRTDIDHSGDFSPLGLQMEEVRPKHSIPEQVCYYTGFEQEKHTAFPLYRTGETATLLLPFPKGIKKEAYLFTFHGYKTSEKQPLSVTLTLGKKELFSTTIASNQVLQKTITLDKKQAAPNLQYLVQNAGNIVLQDGRARDRGSLLSKRNDRLVEFYDLDSEYYQQPQQLLAFCGAACLIKRKVIEDIGFFDGYFFMYYDDIELSLRAWVNGWNIAYEPKAIIYHKHRATTGKHESGFLIYLIERNHLVVLLTYFPLLTFCIQLILFSLRTVVSYFFSLIFLYTNNLKTAAEWEEKYDARNKALRFIVKHAYRVAKNRVFWKKRGKRTYKDMQAFLY